MSANGTDSCRCFRCLRYLAFPATFSSRTLSGTLLSAPVGDVMGWFICENCLDTTHTPTSGLQPVELPLCLCCERVMDADRQPVRSHQQIKLGAARYSAYAFCVDCEPIEEN